MKTNPQNQKKIFKASKKIKKQEFSNKKASNPIIPKQNIFIRAKSLYESQSKKALQNYNISKSDQAWMKKILSSGTLKDKISALCIYIRDNPKSTLESVENMLDYCEKSSKKDSISSINALKNLFIEVLLPSKDIKLQAFNDIIREKDGNNEKILIEAYYESHLRELYYRFLKILEGKIKDPLFFIKKNVLTYLTELILRSCEQDHMIISILINKFGENDKKLIIQLNNSLGRIIHRYPNLTNHIIKEIRGFVYRPNMSQNSQFYAINFLNTISLTKTDYVVLKSLITLFFSLFKRIIKINDKEIASSKLMSNILKGINRVFPLVKSNIDEFKHVYEPEIDNLYRLIHQTESFKVRIQIMLFLFQIASIDNAVSDRYYRVLYEMLTSDEIWHSSLTELFFDLLFFSIKQDQSIPRIKAFIKRLLQNALHSDSAFLITSLIFISKVFDLNPGTKTLITFPEPKEEDSEEEHFEDIDEDNIEENPKKKQNSVLSKSNYDAFKREPLWAKAEETCLWELFALLDHFHPTVRKLTEDILNLNVPLNYKGNPLLDFSLINFLDRLTFKQIKKKTSNSIKNLIEKKRIRMAKIQEPLSLENIGKINEENGREDEKYFLKFFEEKKKREGKKPKKNKNKENKELDDFADEVIESKMEKIEKNGNPDDSDEFDEFLNDDLEMEDDEIDFENDEEIEESLIDEEINNSEEEMDVQREKSVKKKSKLKKLDKSTKKTSKKKKK